MNLGIISDTHDDLLSLKSAIKIFNERKVSHVKCWRLCFPRSSKGIQTFEWQTNRCTWK